MTAAQPAGMAPLATVGQRFLARVIDSAVLVALDFLMSAAVLGGDLSRPGDVPQSRQVVVGVLTFVLYFAYEGAMTAARGQTLGKVLLRIRAARLSDGGVPGPAGWTRAAVYALPGVLTAILIGPLFWLLNSLWCLWDRPYRQCLHDRAARTVVVSAV
ncbi:RDD family protein [Streptomyces sp. V4-01]|uniref:RDD family protein n=1 Tax=Actinacidiphila polyblastidii TaxID=3110430 RepID=A0ABU7P8Q3_9ACTN|nr:RDD family protein [Streptomyces sp. V4-01]